MTIETTKKLFKKASDFAINYFDNTKVVSLHQVDIILNEMYDEHEAHIKAKNENIDMLKEDASNLFHALIDEREEKLYIFDCLKEENKKSRSIIAMLFWKRKRYARVKLREREQSLKLMFDKAYIILKDNK